MQKFLWLTRGFWRVRLRGGASVLGARHTKLIRLCLFWNFLCVRNLPVAREIVCVSLYLWAKNSCAIDASAAATVSFRTPGFFFGSSDFEIAN